MTKRSPGPLRYLRRHKMSAGGTLLEVLVSLVIVCLLASLVVQVEGQTRRAGAQALWEHQHFNAAMFWQSARLSGAKWAQGNAGETRENPSFTWELTALPLTTEAPIKNSPDASWRIITVHQTDDPTEARWQTIIRLPDPASLSSAGERPAPSPLVQGQP